MFGPIVGLDWCQPLDVIYIDGVSAQGLGQEINENMAILYSKGDDVGLFPDGTTIYWEVHSYYDF